LKQIQTGQEEIGMKRQLNSYHYPPILIAFGVILFLTSCKQLGLGNDPPAVERIPTPGSIDPGIELVSDYLICPTVPSTAPLIPPGPYDEELGDCALRGKSAEIEAWLTALEGIAANCLANREPNWATSRAARDHLDAEIDNLEVVEIVETETVESNLGQEAHTTEAEPAICTGYSIPSRVVFSVPDNTPGTTHYYTNWLKGIGENTGKYCTMIDELVKPLWLACDEINFYQDCQEPDYEQYHGIVTERMNDTNDSYEYTDFFYTNILQDSGWNEFRANFNETTLDCPPDLFAPDIKFTFSENAFCRSGPSLQYQKVSTFLALQEVQIVGRNEGDLRWWRVSIPETSEHCWVSDSTGSAAGPVEELEIVIPPPPVNTSTCSSDLSEPACTAAGGTWAGKDTPTPYCDCP
jgi:hypothetical protein